MANAEEKHVPVEEPVVEVLTMEEVVVVVPDMEEQVPVVEVVVEEPLEEVGGLC